MPPAEHRRRARAQASCCMGTMLLAVMGVVRFTDVVSNRLGMRFYFGGSIPCIY